jgi:hypothetical protein
LLFQYQENERPPNLLSSKRIGIDLDNTLIDYSTTAKIYAQKRGIQGIENLADLRIHLKKVSDLQWQIAQAWIYTSGLEFAEPAEGLHFFLKSLSSSSSAIFIVSHKTRFSSIDDGKQDLHQHALRWIQFKLNPEDLNRISNIFFEPTREAKLSRIQSLNLWAFIDDLPEVLRDPGFPRGVRRILYDPYGHYKSTESLCTVKSLSKVELHD